MIRKTATFAVIPALLVTAGCETKEASVAGTANDRVRKFKLLASGS